MIFSYRYREAVHTAFIAASVMSILGLGVASLASIGAATWFFWMLVFQGTIR